MTRPASQNAAARIDQPWPAGEVETVERCPYCGASERTPAHRDVQDWSFFHAPGKWTYWSCTRCQSLYLSPRPTPATLARAYGSYYTHGVPERDSLAHRIKERIIHECWSHRLALDLRPRLRLPGVLGWTLRPLESRLVEPFEIAELAKRGGGRLVDVGCGHGYMLGIAKQLGWHATGLEVDPAAVRAARGRGLEVLEGSYERLAEFPEPLDGLICSHVIEHLYDPIDALAAFARALRPGGVLLLSAPNATSLLRRHFGNDWRGLEAPRHLSIPSMHQLRLNLHALGFTTTQRPLTRLWTADESSRIRRRDTRVTAEDKAVARTLAADWPVPHEDEYDFAELTCVREGRVR